VLQCAVRYSTVQNCVAHHCTVLKITEPQWVHPASDPSARSTLLNEWETMPGHVHSVPLLAGDSLVLLLGPEA